MLVHSSGLVHEEEGDNRCRGNKSNLFPTRIMGIERHIVESSQAPKGIYGDTLIVVRYPSASVFFGSWYTVAGGLPATDKVDLSSSTSRVR